MPQLQPHIRLDQNHGAVCALLPGDPARLNRIKTFLSDVSELAYNREYRSLVGSYQGIRVLAVSTGIGGASAGIAVEELHNLGVQNMIRIGSCGALQPQVKIGDLILVNGAVRDDGASKTYIDPIFPAVPDSELLFACLRAVSHGHRAQPRQLLYRSGGGDRLVLVQARRARRGYGDRGALHDRTPPRCPDDEHPQQRCRV